MIRLLSTFTMIIALLSTYAEADTNGVIRSVEELADVLSQKFAYNRKFELRAIAYTGPVDRSGAFFIVSENGLILKLSDKRLKYDPPINPNDMMLIKGLTAPRFGLHPEYGLVNANCIELSILGPAPPIRHPHITAKDVDRKDMLNRPIRINGILVDMHQDEIDPNIISFTIDCDGRMVYAIAHTATIRESIESIKRLVGATIAIDGALMQDYGTRIHRRRYVALRGTRYMQVLKPPSDDLFNTPKLGDTKELSPEVVVTMGRRRTSGRVLAVWNGDTLLLHTGNKMPMKVGFLGPPPSIGDMIEAVGYVETDLFSDNLENAIWRRVDARIDPEDMSADVSAKDILEDSDGRRSFNMGWYGKRVRLHGVVRDIHGATKASPPRILLDDDGRMVAADCSTVPAAIEKLRVGSVISVIGVCVMDTENWNRHSTLPRVKEMFISVRSSDDITILATPPWWTPARLAAAIGVLLLLLIGILVWNLSLRTLSERRGRELFRNQIARAESELRVEERTRLAAELHDYLAQNLTAISYRLAAAERSRTVEPEALTRHLATATRMLGSCRTELRRCLWDLRSDALDEPDFTAAIRKSAETVANDADVSISWNIARTKISDSTAHTILSITRELVSNAVRHGKARHVRISGELSDGMLRFSVCDDGCGFNPSNTQGAADGHFGLDGIRERLRRHNGELDIKSSPGKGTVISICMQLTGEKHEKNKNPSG